MDLFIVNRYQPVQENGTLGSNEEILRQNLLKKVEERKRKRKYDETAAEIKTEGNVSIVNDHPKKKRKKIAENEDEISNEEAAHTEGAEAEIKPKQDDNILPDRPKKKRKKKKPVEEMEKPEENVVESTVSEFVVLGKDETSERTKAKRVLPYWLKHPSVVSVDLRNLTNAVDSIPELDEKLVQALKKNKITHFFPVQAQVIPWLVQRVNAPEMYWPNDICVSAPTGSGKTLTFVLPIVHALQHRLTPHVRALVVLPVYDLAKQVFNVFETYSAHTTLKAVLLSTSRKLQDEQKQIVKKGSFGGYQCMVDIIVTTPGRLVDHLKNTPGFSLQHLRFLVVDEADRVMEGVQNDWLYHLNTHLGLHSGSSKSFQVPPLCLRSLQTTRRPPQKLLFSATLSQDPEKLQQFGLFQPKLFTSIVKDIKNPSLNGEDEERGEFVGKYTTPAELIEQYTVCSLPNKPLVLLHLLETNGWRNLLCFTKTCDSAHRLAVLLKAMGRGKIKVAEISSKCLTSTRKKRLQLFEAGHLQILVSSDALARGMDIANVETVVSYDAPKFIKNHVHRIGRTGRAGKEGTALTLLLPGQVNTFKKMLEVAGKTELQEVSVSDEEVSKYADIYQTALQSLKKKLDIQSALAKRIVGAKKGKSSKLKDGKMLKE